MKPTASRLHYGYLIVLLGLLNVLGGQGFLRFGYAMILPGMREAMGLTFSQTGALATANYVGYILAALLVGWLVTRFGSRLTIGIGTLTVGVAMSLTGLASSFEQALVLQFIAGAGGLFAVSPTMALAAAWFAPSLRGKAAGAISGGGPLGSLVTGPLVPWLTIVFGAVAWRASWLVLGGAVVVFALLGLAFLRNRPSDVGLTPVGGGEEPKASARASWRSVYSSPLAWYLALLGFASTLAALDFNTFFTSYLVDERGVSTETAGGLWALSGAMGVVSGFLWGGVSDRVGRKKALVFSFAVQAVCYALFASGESVPVFALCAFLYGITARANFTVMAAYCGDIFGPRLAAAVAALGAAGSALLRDAPVGPSAARDGAESPRVKGIG